MIGTAVIDASMPLEGFDFDAADRWHVLVLYAGRPVARVDMPSPGAVSGNALLEAALVRRADTEKARIELIERLARRLGDPQPPPPPLRISVVVCTHRRSQYLPDVMASLGRLDPAPHEVIIVDNDPGEQDSREAVERAGFRYLREDLRGLDNARNAGLRAARGDVVVFTDDDVVVSPAWLEPLPRTFAREGVAAVTGPAFPYLLDTPARVRAEKQASLTRGMRRLVFDQRVISPLGAGAMGVGANMAIRRSRLLELGDEPFPPELDAGTESESGGDTYMLSRLLARGGQIVYEPAMFVFHQHRPDPEALRKAVLGYGIGLSATLTKLLVEERELTAARPWSWLVRQYVRTQALRAAGRADAVETRLSWDYLRGGFLGIGRWRQALETQRAARLGGAPAPRTLPEPEPEPEPQPNPGSSELPKPTGTPAVSVIVPTYKREDVLRRCLDALAAQDVDGSLFEVIVIDDDPLGQAERAATDAAHDYPFELRRLPNAGKGAARARNHGISVAAAPLLLFLDDDIVPSTHFVRRHLLWHTENPEAGALVGSCPPRPAKTGLAASAASLWWQDFFGLLDEASETTFVGALTGNMSVSRAVLERVGTFSEDYARARREDWEWGLRMRRAGMRIDFDKEASARHEFTLSTESRLRHARMEAIGDTLIAAKYPEALSTIPLPTMRRLTPLHPFRWAGFRLWGLPAVRRLTVRLLDLLEAGNFREAWARVFVRAQRASYAQGAYDGAWDPADPPAKLPPPVDLELTSAEPMRPPQVAAPIVRAVLEGHEAARAVPAEGVWAPSFAEQIVDRMIYPHLEQAGLLGGWLAAEPSAPREDVEAIFGPACTPLDLKRARALEEGGTVVRVVGDLGEEHWPAVIAAAQAGDRPLIAIPLPGTRPEPLWLADALTAFDGERVGMAFGGALRENLVPAPLYLHDAESADLSLTLSGALPAYLVLRRELLPLLRGGRGAVEPLLAAFQAALEAGWVVGHRAARGLYRPAYLTDELGEAYATVQSERLAGLPGPERSKALRREARRGAFVAALRAWKWRGRIELRDRRLARGVARASLAAALNSRSTTSRGEPGISPSSLPPAP
jgi:glycosyltransferase involved in cell wall biosynthesis